MEKNAQSEETSIVPTEEGYIDIPRMSIKVLTELTNFVNDVKKTLMVEGKDYIVQGGKQYTARSGFAKLAQGFNLSDEILKEEELIKGGGFYGFNYTVKVYNRLGRQATGVGSCTVDEPNLVHHKDRPYHDCRSIAYTRAWNRAISNFVGSADVSAEEMSIGPDFDAKQVESRQSYPLPDGFTTPTWDFEDALRAEGWAVAGEAAENWLTDAGLDPEDWEVFVEENRVMLKMRMFLGDSFGAVASMLDKAGFKWRSREKVFGLMRPGGVE